MASSSFHCVTFGWRGTSFREPTEVSLALPLSDSRLTAVLHKGLTGERVQEILFKSANDEKTFKSFRWNTEQLSSIKLTVGGAAIDVGMPRELKEDAGYWMMIIDSKDGSCQARLVQDMNPIRLNIFVHTHSKILASHFTDLINLELEKSNESTEPPIDYDKIKYQLQQKIYHLIIQTHPERLFELNEMFKRESMTQQNQVFVLIAAIGCESLNSIFHDVIQTLLGETSLGSTPVVVVSEDESGKFVTKIRKMQGGKDDL